MYRFFFFFFNDTATTEIYTLSLHDALPIYPFHRFSFCHRRECLPTDRSLVTFDTSRDLDRSVPSQPQYVHCGRTVQTRYQRSEEHTSELQSRLHLVCRLLLEKKKNAPLSLLISWLITTQPENSHFFLSIRHSAQLPQDMLARLSQPRYTLTLTALLSLAPRSR